MVVGVVAGQTSCRHMRVHGQGEFAVCAAHDDTCSWFKPSAPAHQELVRLTSPFNVTLTTFQQTAQLYCRYPESALRPVIPPTVEQLHDSKVPPGSIEGRMDKLSCHITLLGE